MIDDDLICKVIEEMKKDVTKKPIMIFIDKEHAGFK